MKSSQELQKELDIIKRKELKEKWEVYLDRVKKYINNLKGKALISHYRNGGFIIYKVLGYEEHYYATREGFNGTWGPCRWLEIKTSSYINCHVADDKGRWYGGKIDHNNNCGNFKALVYKNKSYPKELEISKIEFNEISANGCSLTSICDIVKIGYTEYEEYREDPNYDRALDRFTLFTQLAPEGMWEAAKSIADDNLVKTKNFWEVFEPKCKGLKPIYNVFPL